ncbi:MAG: hypothetical protein LBG96_00630 [Tannerella sp.]|jgi:hypothetical protein|nr:hypothetical protein [Tannerella sp.]
MKRTGNQRSFSEALKKRLAPKIYEHSEFYVTLPEEVPGGIRAVAEGGRFLCDHVNSLLQNLKNIRRNLPVLEVCTETFRIFVPK